MATSPQIYAQLPHAYGPATDTLEHLRLLLSGEPQAMEDGWRYVYGAVLHQATPFPAAVRFLADLIEVVQTQPNHPATVEIAQFIAGIAQALKDAALTMDILRLSVPADIDEQLRALAEAEGEEFWDAALCWTLLHCAEQVPQARAALQPLKAYLDDAVSRAAVEALDDLAAAEAVLNGRSPEPD